MKIQFTYAFNVTNAESTVNASERIWGALSCRKHTARAKNLSSAEQNAEEPPNMLHYKTSRLMLWKPWKKNPGDIEKKFNKTRGKLKVDQSEIVECRPNASVNDVIMKMHPETQQEKISRNFWNLCKNWNINISLNQGGTNATSIKQIGKDLHHTIMLPLNCNWSMYWNSWTGNGNDNHDNSKPKQKKTIPRSN